MDDPCISAYLLDCRRRNLSPVTIEDRRRLLRRFPPPLLEATQAVIEEWLDTCDIGPRARYSYLSALAGFFEWAVDRDLRVDNPTERIRRPKLPRSLPRPISEADLEYALSAADLRMKAWLCLAAFAGLRCKEIAALRREDIQLDREPPIIVVRQGKGDKDGVVPMNPRVEDALRGYGLRPGYLFRLNDGRPISARTLSSYINRFLHGIGIEATAHRGRHLFGTSVYRLSGGDLLLTQEMLRHSSPATVGVYAAFDQAKAAEVVSRLGRPKVKQVD